VKLFVSIYGPYTFGSAQPSQGICTYDTRIVTCDLGSLARGEVAAVRFLVTLTSVGPTTSTAYVVGDEPDLNTSNNKASAETRVPRPPNAPGFAPDPAGTPV